MEWNMKIPSSWDFTEFEQGTTIPNMDSSSNNNNGSSSTSSCYGGQGIKGNFSVDLKLGQVIDSGNEFKEDSLKSSTSSKMALSPSGSSKRARPINSTLQAPSCLVDGCYEDLSNYKDYNRRHKVCEVHSKTSEVSINGQKQRFCQQCSRFHSLEEFDEGKRSCRKRLDGHNRRRRKPQPDALRGPSVFASHQGPTMLQFSSPNMYQTTTLTNPLWTTSMVKAEEEPTFSTRHLNLTQNPNPNPFPEPSSSTKRVTGKQQFNLFQTNNPGTHLKLNQQTSPSKQLLSFETNNSNYENKLIYCDGYPPPPATARLSPVVQSDCALSLLSSSPSQTSCTTLNHVMHHHPSSSSFSAPPNHLDHPGSTGYGGLESFMDPNRNEMIQMGLHQQQRHHHLHRHHQESPDNGVPQTLPFYWE